MEFKEWSNNLDEVLENFNELMKTKEEKEKEMPCHEYLKFDQSFNLISKEQYCNITTMLLKLFSLDYNQDMLIFYDESKNEWKSYIGRDRIAKKKLSEICYEIHYDDKETALCHTKTLYIIITRQIKSCYKSEFELKPILVPIDMNLSYIPTVGNFAPSNLIVNTKYAITDIGNPICNNYKTFKINTTLDYE